MEEEEIRTLERGEYFGEQALLREECRTASVIALSPGVECLTLDRDSFIQLIGDLSEIKEKDYGDEHRVLSRPNSTVSVCSEKQGESIINFNQSFFFLIWLINKLGKKAKKKLKQLHFLEAPHYQKKEVFRRSGKPRSLPAFRSCKWL